MNYDSSKYDYEHGEFVYPRVKLSAKVKLSVVSGKLHVDGKRFHVHFPISKIHSVKDNSLITTKGDRRMHWKPESIEGHFCGRGHRC